MPNASKLSPESRFMALFVGPKHSGKTAAACSWRPQKKKVKVLDGDGRIRGILGCPWIERESIDYDYYPPRVADNDKTFYERVNGDCDYLLDQIQKGASPYETYVGDSATAFCKNLLMDAIPLTHEKKQGRRIGTMEMAGPSDYGFESTGFDSYLSFLRSLPINVIVTAHVIDKFDKPLKEDGSKDTYAESIVVGEKLSLRDKISANCTIYFDHIFRFDRKMINREEHFFVEFISDIACTSFPSLKPGKFDITGINFYDFVMSKVRENTQIPVSTGR